MRLLAGVAALFVLASSASAMSYPSDPLRYLKLPRLAFTNATLDEVAATLAREYTSTQQEGSPQVIQFLIHPSCSNIAVTVDFEYISVYNTLDTLRQMYGIEYMSTPSGHLLLARRDALPMIYRFYDVLPSVFSESTFSGSDVVPFFSQFGIDFPSGASATYSACLGKLFVRNHISALDTLEKVISVLNCIPYQIEATLRVLQVTDMNLALLAQQYAVQANTQALVDGSETLLSLSALAASGQTATNIVSIENAATKSRGASRSSATVVFSPAVFPDGQALSLGLRASLALTFGKNQQLSYAIDTTITINDGANMLLWLTPPTSTEKDSPVLCLVVSARLIDLSGKALSEGRRSHIDKEVARRLIGLTEEEWDR